MDNKQSFISWDYIFGWLGLFCISCIMYMLNTTIQGYAAEFATITALTGLITGIYTIGGLFSRFFGAGLMGKLGWKKVTLIFAFLQIVATALYFVVGHLGSDDANYWMLFLVRLVHGLAFGTCASGIITIGTANIPKASHGTGMGSFMLATTLAGGVGPTVGNIIINNYGAQGGFVAAIILSVFIFLFILFTKVELDPSKRKLENGETVVANTAPKVKGIKAYIEVRAIPISFCNMLFALSYAGVATYIRSWANATGEDVAIAYGSFFIIQMIVQLICQPLYGKIQDKTGSDNIPMYLGMVMQAVTVSAMFIMPGIPTMYACAIGTAMGYNSLKSATQAVANRGIPSDRQPQAISTFWIFTDFGMGVGPMLLGLFAGFGGTQYGAIFLAAGIICLLSIPIYWAVWGRKSIEEKAAIE